MTLMSFVSKILFLFSGMFFFWLPALCQGNISSSKPDINEEALEKQLTDSMGFEIIIEKINDTSQNPELSLAYIKFYEKMSEKHPNIPVRMKDVQKLKGRIYNSLAWNNNRTNSELAFAYIDSSQEAYDAAEFELGYWHNLYGKATIYKNKGENKKALQFFDEYLANFLDPFDSIYVANVQFQRGVVLMQLGNYDESANALIEAVRLDEQLGRFNSQASCLNSLANLYKRTGMKEEALKVYDQARKVHLKMNDSLGVAQVTMNKANLLATMDMTSEARAQYDTSLIFSGNNTNAHSFIYENLGNLFMKNEVYDSALFYLKASLDIRMAQKNERELYIIEYKVGKCHMEMGNYPLAYPFLERSFRVARAQGEQENVMKIANDLSTYYEKTKDFKRALEFKDLYVNVKDSLLTLDIAKQIADVNTKYETEKKEQEIKLLAAQNDLSQSRLRKNQYLLIFLIAGLGLLGSLTVQISKSRQKVKKLNRKLQDQNEIINAALKEKDLLLKEIHHRVKNNLQVISSLLGIQSRSLSDKAAIDALNEGRTRVQSMSLIHQDLYRQDSLSGINIKTYFDKLIQNLFDTYNLNRNDIKIKSEIQELILDVDTIIPLGLMINELITNALKYAFPHKKGNVTVTISEKENSLEMSVKDDGIGFFPDDQSEQHSSYGFELIKALVEKLDGSLTIHSNQGTEVIVILKSYHKAA